MLKAAKKKPILYCYYITGPFHRVDCIEPRYVTKYFVLDHFFPPSHSVAESLALPSFHCSWNKPSKSYSITLSCHSSSLSFLFFCFFSYSLGEQKLVTTLCHRSTHWAYLTLSFCLPFQLTASKRDKSPKLHNSKFIV